MADERHDGVRRTARLSEEALQRIRDRLVQQHQGERISLLVYHRDGLEAIPLIPGRRAVVGRFPPSDVIIRDASLSAEHAAVTLLDGVVWVEDLGSTNGTRIDGAMVERARLEPGSELVLGAVVAAVHAMGDAGESSPDLIGHDGLVRELEIEAARARTFDRSLALVMLRRPGRHASHWFEGVSGRLRPFDRAALYSGDTVEVLLPDAGSGEARALAEGAADGGLRAGFATIPAGATTSEALLASAREALGRTSAKTPVCGAHEGGGAGPADLGKRPVVRSAAMQEVFNVVGRLAASDIPVLILGETGTGKEVLARAIHEGGSRRKGRLVCVNCGGIPQQLVESTLFGHERGAFTGAERRGEGVFEAAQGGTVLLDEIGELPPGAQAALLRILENKRYCRVGSTEEIEADVRILAATHRDLPAMCDEGGFRRDLFYRLEAMTLRLPPLRERIEEIEPLTRRFLDLASKASGRVMEGLDGEALERLHGYPWPGNVRELRNVIERAVVIAAGEVITVDDLPDKIRRVDLPTPVAPDRPEEPDRSEGTLKERLAEVEARFILEAIEAAEWDRRRASADLGLPLRTLAHKMQLHGIRRQRYDRS